MVVQYNCDVLRCHETIVFCLKIFKKIRIFYFDKDTEMIDRVSVPSPIAIDILMDTMARDRAHMYLFSV